MNEDLTPLAAALTTDARLSYLQRLRRLFTQLKSDEAMESGQKSANELASIRTDLAVSRTLMAADRTLMAWVRTALSLNSFGFTLYKLLQNYAETQSHLPAGDTARNMGLFLTGMGSLAMVMGVVEYWHTLEELRRLKKLRYGRSTLIMGLLMSAMGIFLFLGIVTKIT